MHTILITGAASGLGRTFVHLYAKRFSSTSESSTGGSIYALDRTAIDIESLFADTPYLIEWAHNHVHSMTLDITDEEAVAHLFSTRLARVTLDLIIHSAGIRGLVNDGRGVSQSSEVAEVETAEVMDSKTMKRAFEVNAIGSFLLLRGCVPALQRASKAIQAQEQCDGGRNGGRDGSALPKVVIMGSRMGSIGHNESAGGAYAYRASKAALNALVKSFSIDFPEAIWTIIHPGRVETGLVRIKEEGAMSVQESVAAMISLITSLERKDSGMFIDRFGERIPW